MSRKRINLLTKALLAVILVLIAAVVIIIVGKNELDKRELDIQAMADEMENNRQIVYVVKDIMISKGDTLLAEGDEANVMKQEIYSGLEPDYYITDEDIGSVAIVDMAPGTPILKNMVSTIAITHDTRIYEIGAVNLMADQMVNDYIDVRIMFPNGEDYLVLSKKKIIKEVLDTSLIYTYMNEDEILRYASATVDAYVTTGAYLYTTKYVESNLQDEAIPNYPVKANVIDLMTSDPNIVSYAQYTLNLTARMNLEQKLSGLTQEQLEAVAEGHGIEDTAKTSVLMNPENYSIVDEDTDLEKLEAMKENGGMDAESEEDKEQSKESEEQAELNPGEKEDTEKLEEGNVNGN